MIAIMVCAVSLRFHGIDHQGARFADEGTYCVFGKAIYEDVPNQVGEKAGHALLVSLSYRLFGFEVASPIRLSAFVGSATVLAIYLLGRILYDSTAGLIAASAVASMPMFIFYHRSAMTDGNYHFLAVVGLILAALAIRADGRRRLWCSAAAGVPLSLAFCVNPPASLFAALGTAGVLTACRRKGVLPAVMMSLTGLGTYCVFVWATRRYVNWNNTGQMYAWRAKWVLGFEPSWWFLRNLWTYAGRGVVVAGLLGVLVALRTRSDADFFVLTLLIGLVAFCARLRLQFPRIYLPLTVPLVLFAGRLGSCCLRRLAHGRPVWLALLCLGLCLNGIGGVRDFIKHRSGYETACRWLVADGTGRGLSTHSWWLLQAFVGRRFSYVTPALADVLKRERPEFRGVFKKMVDRGFTHMVIDYFLWREINASARKGLVHLLREMPPTLTVPNPLAAFPPTSREDDAIPSLEHEPLSHYIYIYRLKDYLQG